MWIKEFKALTTRELFEIYRARTDVFVVEQACAYPEVDTIDLTAQHVFSTTADGQVQAYCRIYRDELRTDHWHIGRVLVAKTARGHGVARELVQTAIDWIKKQPEAKVIDIEAQVYLSAFYQQMGFEIMSKPFDDFGIAHQEMSQTLVN